MSDQNIPPTKRCTKCSEIKPITEFHRSPKGKYGVVSDCKRCVAERHATYWRRQHPQPKRETLPDGHKRCTRCKQVKPTDEFYKYRHSKDGLKAYCKRCEIDAVRAYQKAHPGEIKASRRANFLSHKEQINKRRRDYRHKRANCINAQRRAERMSDPDKFTYEREYKKANYEKGRAQKRAWVKANPVRVHQHRVRREARVAQIPFDFEDGDWSAALNFFEGRCAYCGNPPGLLYDMQITRDHFIPVTDSACPGTIPCNIVPACQSCNSSKGNRDAVKWLNRRYGKRKAAEKLKRILAYFKTLD